MLVLKPCARTMISRIFLLLQGTEQPPVLLVDGYNVLHMYVQHMQDSQPKSAVGTTQVLEELRTGLESLMITYSHSRRIKVVVVYDAINRSPDPVYVDIRSSTRLAHSAFNLLSTYVRCPDVLPCSLCTTFLQYLCSIKFMYQDTHLCRRLQGASGDTALFTIVDTCSTGVIHSTELLALLRTSSAIIVLMQPLATHHQPSYCSVS